MTAPTAYICTHAVYVSGVYYKPNRVFYTTALAAPEWRTPTAAEIAQDAINRAPDDVSPQISSDFVGQN